jgi:hypothetical protein
MTDPSFRSTSEPHPRLGGIFRLAILAAFALGLSQTPTRGQSQATEDLGDCTLKDHVYHCDGAVFQKALNDAGRVEIETHNADGVARDRLTAFVTGKLGKTVVPPGAPADLSFLMLPVDDQGVLFGGDIGGVNLGTLRIYTVTPSGSRGRLLWAETFTGQPEMPWPAVVRGLILQFQSRFHIK